MNLPTVVDFYGQCIDGLIMYLQFAMAAFFPVKESIGRNDAQLNAGADYFLFFRPSTFPLANPTPNHLIKDYNWVAHANLYGRYNEYETSWANFEKVRAALIFYIGVDPALSAYDTGLKNVGAVTVEAIGDALPFRSTKEFGTFIIQPLRFTITQRVTFPLFYKRSTP